MRKLLCLAFVAALCVPATAQDGDIARLFPNNTIAYADGALYLRAESGRGTVALIEATPAGYREKGRFDQPGRTRRNSWTHPVIAGGRLYLRDQDSLLCYDVKAR